MRRLALYRVELTDWFNIIPTVVGDALLAPYGVGLGAINFQLALFRSPSPVWAALRPSSCFDSKQIG